MNSSDLSSTENETTDPNHQINPSDCSHVDDVTVKSTDPSSTDLPEKNVIVKSTDLSSTENEMTETKNDLTSLWANANMKSTDLGFTVKMSENLMTLFKTSHDIDLTGLRVTYPITKSTLLGFTKKMPENLMMLLRRSYKIDLTGCLWVDNAIVEILVYFQNKFPGCCQNISLAYCKNVTSIGNLQCHTINLAYCSWVTDEILEKLGDITTINLRGCENFTDKGLAFLQKCKVLDLSDTNVTNIGLGMLKHCEALYLSDCTKITDRGVLQLKHVNRLDLSRCNITDLCLRELTKRGITIIDDRTQITDEGVG
jgi:hypothetical protein